MTSSDLLLTTNPHRSAYPSGTAFGGPAKRHAGAGHGYGQARASASRRRGLALPRATSTDVQHTHKYFAIGVSKSLTGSAQGYMAKAVHCSYELEKALRKAVESGRATAVVRRST